MTYQTISAQQRNFNFFAFFSALYLVVSDILLTQTQTHTHTHTHTQALLASKYIFLLLSYARAKRTVSRVNKGLLGVSFVYFFMSFFVCVEYQNKEKRIDKSVLLICHNNSLIIFCFLSLISRAGSDNALSACREGERKVRRFI